MSPRPQSDLAAPTTVRPNEHVGLPFIVDPMRQALKAIINHWDEFGPEHGFAEVIDRARDALT
jgi:hypothetical protein